MSSKTSTKQQAPAVTQIQTMRGHTDEVRDVVHLPGGRRIITCSSDGSLRKIALSPNGKIVSSGSQDGKVRLWDVKTGRVIRRWTGHTGYVSSVCWSANGKQIMSGSWDGRVRVWNVRRGERILEIKTGHEDVWAAIYSPDNKQIATGGFSKNRVKIWDAKMGELITTLKHDWIVLSLAWTSDGKKLITGSYGPIRIFDTATWEQTATLEGHTNFVNTISLSHNNRLLASASDDKTARIWNLDTNLPVESPLQHKGAVYSTAFSANGRVLVTGCHDKNAYAWDVKAMLKQAGLEHLLSTGDAPKDKLKQTSHGEPGIQPTPRSSFSDKSFLQADATRGHDEFGGVDELPLRFFDRMEVNDDSSPMGSAHPHSSASALLARLASLLHRFRPDNAEANEPSQLPTLSGFYPRALFTRLSSLIHRSPAENDAPNELQQPSTSSRLHLHAILVSLSSLFPRSQLDSEDTEPHNVTPSRSRPNALMGLLSSRFRSQRHTNQEIELSRLARPVTTTDTFKTHLRHIFARPPHHATPLVVDVSFAKGKERNIAAGAPGKDPNIISDEEYENLNTDTQQDPNTRPQQQAVAVHVDPGEHGGGKSCICC